MEIINIMKSRIILVGGSSHVGKTLVAQKLMEKLNIPYLSLDHLKMGLIRAGITELTVEQDDAMRTYLWPIVAEMIKTAIENNQSMIVEGCYIPSDWRKCFEEKYLTSISETFLVMSEQYIRDHIEDIVNYGDVIENRLYKDVDLERLVRCSKWFKEDALKYGNHYFEIDGEYNLRAIINDILQR